MDAYRSRLINMRLTNLEQLRQVCHTVVRGDLLHQKESEILRQKGPLGVIIIMQRCGSICSYFLSAVEIFISRLPGHSRNAITDKILHELRSLFFQCFTAVSGLYPNKRREDPCYDAHNV